MKTPPFLKDFIDLFFPRLCPVCQRALNRNEENICTTCLHRLPRTGYHLDPLSPMYWAQNEMYMGGDRKKEKRFVGQRVVYDDGIKAYKTKCLRGFN